MNTKVIYTIIICCVAFAQLTACGGDGGNTTAVKPVDSPEQRLINSINLAKSEYVNPLSYKKVSINGVESLIASGLVFASLRETLSLVDAETFFQTLATLNVEVASVMPGSLTIQLKLPSGSDEASVVEKLQALPAVVAAWPSKPIYTNDLVNAVSSLTSTPEWWRVATRSREAFSAYQLSVRKSNYKQTSLAMVDTSLEDSTANHAADVKRFLVGNSITSPIVEGMFPGGVVDQYAVYPIDFVPALNSVLGFFGDNGFNAAVNSGAKVINMSVGQATSAGDQDATNEKELRSTSLLGPLKKCHINDCLVVKASGNDGLKNDNVMLSDKTNSLANRMRWADHGLIVGASNVEGKDATFSRMGSTVQLLAPGNMVGAYSQVNGPILVGTPGKLYPGIDGASYSTPMVSGVAAMVRTVAPSLRAAEVKRVLISTANPIVGFQTAAQLNADNFEKKWYSKRDHVQAVGPSVQLDARRAVESADALEAIGKKLLPQVELAFGKTQTVNITATRSVDNKLVDVVFLFDVSGSTEEQRSDFQTTSNSILASIKSAYANSAFGIAIFSDYPTSRVDSLKDKPFEILKTITSDPIQFSTSIATLSSIQQNGGNVRESQLDAIYQLATGKGRDVNNDGSFQGVTDILPSSVGWRTGAKRIVILFTDSAYNDKALDIAYLGMTKNETVTAVNANNLSVFALLPNSAYDATFDDFGLPIYQRLTAEMNGSAEVIGLGTAKITQSIRQAVDSSFNKLAKVTLEGIGGAAQIDNISPQFQLVAPGGVANFTVTLRGVIPEDIAKKEGSSIFPISIWAGESSTASTGTSGQFVLQRFEIPVSIPAGGIKLANTKYEPLRKFLSRLAVP